MQHSAALSQSRADCQEQLRLGKTMALCREEWLACPAASLVLDGLRRFGAGEDLAENPALARLFCRAGVARAFVDEWVTRHVAVLSGELLGQVAHAYQASRGASVISLAKSGTAELSLVCFDEVRGEFSPDPQTVQFADVERHEAILAGSAETLIIRRREDRVGTQSFTIERRVFSGGDFVSHYGDREAKCVLRVQGRFVFLRLSRTNPEAGPVQQYRLSDGTLMSQASGNKRESCREMMMAVLCRMGRKDAALAIADLAITGSDHMRWEAMRHCLSLDTANGFRILTDMAQSVDDPLAVQSGVLRAQLLEMHPGLGKFEVMPCRD